MEVCEHDARKIARDKGIFQSNARFIKSSLRVAWVRQTIWCGQLKGEGAGKVFTFCFNYLIIVGCESERNIHRAFA